jgi:hypothetical protein
MVLMHFTHHPTDGLGLAALVAGPGPTALLRSRLGFTQFAAGDSYPAVETDPEIQRGQKIRAANVRERSASHWPRCRCRVRIPRADIAARSEPVALRVGLRAAARAKDLLQVRICIGLAGFRTIQFLRLNGFQPWQQQEAE